MAEFKDRKEAGLRLAGELESYRGADAIVYALPRGGVVLGYEVAESLHVPLDLIITRKIGHPHNPEYAICAISEEGAMVCDEAERSLVDATWLETEVERERREAARRRQVYLHGRARRSATGKIALVVDDGVATGLTLRAALETLRKESPKKLVVAVPVCPGEAARELREMADEVIVLVRDEPFLGAVGAYYESFPQVADKEVIDLMAAGV